MTSGSTHSDIMRAPTQWRVASRPASAKILTLLVCLAVVLCAGVVAGCGGGGETPDASGGSTVETVTIEQALRSEEGRSVAVQGHLVADAQGVRLASALLESYPPQAGGAVLAVAGLDLEEIVGLRSAGGSTGGGQVNWTDYPVTLQGEMNAGALEVKKVPQALATTTPEVRVRLCLTTVPLVAGSTTWWVFDVTCLSDGPVDLTFGNGQMGEVVLSQDGVEKYRWSEGKAFIEAIRVDTLQPGDTMPYVFNDVLQVAPGEYDLTATVVATAGPAGGTLPALTTKVTVR